MENSPPFNFQLKSRRLAEQSVGQMNDNTQEGGKDDSVSRLSIFTLNLSKFGRCLSCPTLCYTHISRLTNSFYCFFWVLFVSLLFFSLLVCLLFFLLLFLGYPVIVNRTNQVVGSLVAIRWKPCTASLFTICHREILPEGKSLWNAVNVSGNETSYDLHLRCRRDYEIAITAWNSTAETPLTGSLNHRRLWSVRTLGGNCSHAPFKTPTKDLNLRKKYLSMVVRYFHRPTDVCVFIPSFFNENMYGRYTLFGCLQFIV